MVLGDRLAGVNLGGNVEVGVTVPDIRAYTRETHAFTALGGFQGTAYELSGAGEPAQINAARMTVSQPLSLSKTARTTRSHLVA
jgi:hypothetical protein